MITLQVNDRSGTSMYSVSRYGELHLDDKVKVQRWDGGLKLVEPDGRVHKFNKQGEYIGSHS